MTTFPMILAPQPGIQRDSTNFDNPYCIDGQWVRFYNGKPRKIGGYKLISLRPGGIVRSCFTVPKADGSAYVYMGQAGSLSFVNVNNSGDMIGDVVVCSFPPDTFVPSEFNEWSFDVFSFSETVNSEVNSYLIAQCSPNLGDVASATEGYIFYAKIGDHEFKNIGVDGELGTFEKASGGIVCLFPGFIFSYGTDGLIKWNKLYDNTVPPSADNPSPLHGSWPNYNLINGLKIVYGARTRGGNTQSALFWSLNSLIRATYSPLPSTSSNPLASSYFSFEIIDENITILSDTCVVKYNNMFFWVGNGQFYVYTGAVQVLPNLMNANFFFDNLNHAHSEKVWGLFNQRYKEIWWFFPFGSSTECNHAIVYNVESQVWYDTAISRSAGDPALFLSSPIMADSQNLPPNKLVVQDPTVFPLWFHEFGWDYQAGEQTLAIPSYFETNLISIGVGNQGEDVAIRVRRFEPDFLQTKVGENLGEMSLTVHMRDFPNSLPVSSKVYSFNASTDKIDLSEMGRLISFKITSNALGGNYQMGKPIIDIEKGDIRPAPGNKQG